ncbi:MAG TPA: hypothetical protein VIZ18_12615 [Ktedonobacteraceae bacterium]
MEIYKIERRQEVKELRRGFFRSPQLQLEPVEVFDSIGRGWILGEFNWWHWNGPSSVERTCLTALLDLSLEDWQKLSYDGNNGTLACVQPCSGGYEVLTGGRLKEGNWDGRNDSWVEAMQAVKRLIGESS